MLSVVLAIYVIIAGKTMGEPLTLGCKTMWGAHGFSSKDHGGSPWNLDVRPCGEPMNFQLKTMGGAHGT